jgi:hypothetical protein
MSDRTSKALAEASLPGEPRTYDTTSKLIFKGPEVATIFYILPHLVAFSRRYT